MPYNAERYERYAMLAEEMSQKAAPGPDGIEIDAVGESLGFTREESREIALLMQRSGWATAAFMEDKPRLWLTRQGYEEIAKLRRPAWRQWIDRHPMTMNVFWMTTT